MVRVPNDHMVKHFDSEELPGTDQIPRHLDVGFRGLRLAARMIVRQYYGGSPRNYCSPKHFARMHEGGVEGANRYQLVPFDPATSIQEQDYEAFAFGVVIRAGRNVQPPVFRDFFWRVADLHGLRQRTLAQ